MARSHQNEPCYIVQDTMVFDILETLVHVLEESGNEREADDLRAGFSRNTDGVDLEYVIDAIRSWDLTI